MRRAELEARLAEHNTINAVLDAPPANFEFDAGAELTWVFEKLRGRETELQDLLIKAIKPGCDPRVLDLIPHAPGSVIHTGPTEWKLSAHNYRWICGYGGLEYKLAVDFDLRSGGVWVLRDPAGILAVFGIEASSEEACYFARHVMRNRSVNEGNEYW